MDVERGSGRRPSARWHSSRAISEAAGEETSPDPVARRHDRRLRDAGQRQLGHLRAARRRAQRDADRQRSAARRRRSRRSRPTAPRSRSTSPTRTAASSSPARRASRSGASPTSASIPRGRPTASRSRSPPRKSTIPRRARRQLAAHRRRRRRRAAEARRRRRDAGVLVAIGPAHRLLEQHGGQRDLYTVATAGGQRVAVTNDAAIDWSPVWSPDGRFIYFSSDRGGAMNLWRIAVDGRAGARTGAPEPVTAGVQASAALRVFEGRLPPGLPLARRRRSIPWRFHSIRSRCAPACPSCSTRRTTSACRATCRRTASRSRTSASANGRRTSSSARRAGRSAVSPTMPPAIERRVHAGRPVARVLFEPRRQLGAWTIGLDGGGLRKIAIPQAGPCIRFITERRHDRFLVGDDGRSAFSAPVSPGVSAPPTPLRGGSVWRQGTSPR